ncbi:MAG: AAA family ATPase [Lentimonas sp.]
MRFFELAQKLKLSHEELCQWLRDEAVVDPETPDADIDPFMTLSNEDVFNIVADFTESKEPKDNQSRVSGVGISHFKAFGQAEQQIPLKPLTFIFGPNSAGKSSFLHSLLWAEDAFNTGKLDVIRPRLSGDMVDLGGLRNVIHRKGADGSTFSLRYTFAPEQQSQPLIAAIGENKTIHLELTVDAGAISEEEFMKRLVDSINDDDSPVNEDLNGGASVTRYALYLGNEEAPFLRLSRRKGGHFVVNNFDVTQAEFESHWKTVQQGFTFASAVSDFESSAMQLFLDWTIQDIAVSGGKTLPNSAKFNGPPLNVEDAIAELFGADMSSDYDERSSPEDLADGDVAEAYAEHHEDDEYEPDPNDFQESYREPDEPDYHIPSPDELERSSFDRKKLEDIATGVQLYAETTVETLVAECSSMLLSYLKSLVYLGSQRAYPDRGFTFTTKRDQNWRANGGEAWDRLAKDGKLREKVNSWLQDGKHLKAPYKLAMRRFVDVANAYNQAFDALEADYNQAAAGEADLSTYHYETEPENSHLELLSWDTDVSARNILSSIESGRDVEKFSDLYLVDTRSDTIVSHRDVGVGISQIIPILATAMSLEGKTVAIEEPESHLHPKAQTELADVFIETALTGENPNRYIIETHSEHLILRLLRRIRECHEGDDDYPDNLPQIHPEDVSIVYLDPTKDGSIAYPLRISEDGDFLDQWPAGFFEERREELF